MCIGTDRVTETASRNGGRVCVGTYAFTRHESDTRRTHPGRHSGFNLDFGGSKGREFHPTKRQRIALFNSSVKLKTDGLSVRTLRHSVANGRSVRQANRLSHGHIGGEVGTRHPPLSSGRRDLNLSGDRPGSRFPPTSLRLLLRHRSAWRSRRDQNVLVLSLSLREVAQTQLLGVREHDGLLDSTLHTQHSAYGDREFGKTSAGDDGERFWR